MSVTMELEYEGELRTRATHPSGATFVTDAPLDNEGRAESFSPTDLLATALGTCMMTIMGIVARRHKWPIEGTRVTVSKEMVTEPERRVGQLTLTFWMPAGVPESARVVLERAAHTCPVATSLGEGVVIDATFDWA